MERVVMTRKTSTKELEQKLKQALEELRSSKDLCKNLLQEREDSEEEIRNIVRRNTDLKGQLAELHTDYLDIVAQRDHLRNLVTAFDQCSNEHERALDRISDLESDLIQARKSISDWETCKFNVDSQHTHSLYEELVECNSHSQQTTQSDPINNNAVIIDLTKDESSIMHPIYFSSHNKLKKYIKVNKFIKKCNKVINNKFSAKKITGLKTERLKLIKKINYYNRELIESRTMYERDTQDLQDQISQLTLSLDGISKNYELSQNQIKEHIQASSNLVDLCNYNMERFESLTNNYYNCNCATEKLNIVTKINSEVVGDSAIHTHDSRSHKKVVSIENSYKINNSSVVSLKNINNYFVYSDQLGQGFGSLLSNHLNNVYNICLPGASYQHITDKINNLKCSENSTIVLLYGDGLSVKKNEIIKNIEKLLNLYYKSNCKFVMGTFPYSSSYTDKQNKYIYNLNMTLYNLTYRHSDAFFYFDINKFIYNSFKMTKGTMYLPFSNKKQIATLVAFNLKNFVIQDITKNKYCENNIMTTNNNQSTLN